MTEPTSNPNDSRINLDKTEQPSHPSEPQPDPHPQSYQGSTVGQPPAPAPYAAPYPGQYPYAAEYRAAAQRWNPGSSAGGGPAEARSGE
ncbi:MAG: hypothetical protein HXO54_05840, partial [Rothia dentocariosa]|nr:hypothetical protein [Rothia dentocariosa]